MREEPTKVRIGMQILVGPTYNMEVSASASSPVCIRDRSTSSGDPASSAAAEGVSSSCLFFNGYEDEKENDVVGDEHTFGSDDSSSDSSSIGVPGEDDDEEEEEGNQNDVAWSPNKGFGLPRNKFSMDSLEDSLLNKRGLSNHYSGKSKSFGNLTEVMSKSTEIKDLEKEENPLNKRRRVLIAKKWSRKFFYSRHNPKSMPILPIIPDDVEEQEEEEEEEPQTNEDQEHVHGNKLKLKMSFKSQSCFCLADLAEEVEEEDD